MTEHQRTAQAINEARANNQLVYAWPQRFAGRYLVYAAKYSGKRLRVQLASGVWATVNSGDVEFMPDSSICSLRAL